LAVLIRALRPRLRAARAPTPPRPPPPAIISAALVPRPARSGVEPVRTIVACFAWGAIGAVLLSLIGGLIFEAAFEESLGAKGAEVLSVVVGAPLIEESFKGIAVLVVLIFARSEFDDVLD